MIYCFHIRLIYVKKKLMQNNMYALFNLIRVFGNYFIMILFRCYWKISKTFYRDSFNMYVHQSKILKIIVEKIEPIIGRLWSIHYLPTFVFLCVVFSMSNTICTLPCLHIINKLYSHWFHNFLCSYVNEVILGLFFISLKNFLPKFLSNSLYFE